MDVCNVAILIILNSYSPTLSLSTAREEMIMENKIAQTPKIKSITSLENDLLSRKLYITIDMMKEYNHWLICFWCVHESYIDHILVYTYKYIFIWNWIVRYCSFICSHLHSFGYGFTHRRQYHHHHHNHHLRRHRRHQLWKMLTDDSSWNFDAARDSQFQGGHSLIEFYVRPCTSSHDTKFQLFQNNLYLLSVLLFFCPETRPKVNEKSKFAKIKSTHTHILHKEWIMTAENLSEIRFWKSIHKSIVGVGNFHIYISSENFSLTYLLHIYIFLWILGMTLFEQIFAARNDCTHIHTNAP